MSGPTNEDEQAFWDQVYCAYASGAGGFVSGGDRAGTDAAVATAAARFAEWALAARRKAKAG